MNCPSSVHVKLPPKMHPLFYILGNSRTCYKMLAHSCTVDPYSEIVKQKQKQKPLFFSLSTEVLKEASFCFETVSKLTLLPLPKSPHSTKIGNSRHLLCARPTEAYNSTRRSAINVGSCHRHLTSIKKNQTNTDNAKEANW